MSRDNMINIFELDDKKKAGDFFGSEAIGVYQIFKQAKRKTSKQMGYISMYLPEDWIDPFMLAALGKKPKYNFMLLKIPIK